MESTFELIAVAYLQGTGGRFRLLLAIDRDGEALFAGEPAILVEHRPGRPGDLATFETADVIGAAGDEIVAGALAQIVELIEAAFDSTGMFDGERLVGRTVVARGAQNAFES